MKGKVSRLCDISGIEIPAQMLEVSVDAAQVKAGVRQLSLRYALESEVQCAQMGDTVFCTADAQSYPDGRTVIVFTQPTVPGAEEAALAVTGKCVGDVVKTVLAGKAAELTVKKIVHRTPAEINDALIASLGIDGVSTVSEYEKYLGEKMLADLRMERSKELSHFYMDMLVAESGFEYDEDELEQYAQSCLSEWKTEYAEAGMDDVSDDEIINGVKYQTKQEWLAEAVCEMLGHTCDMAEIEAEADRMTEMMTLMGESVPPREEMLKMGIKDDKFTAMFGYIDGIIAEKIGGSHGNG